MGTEWERTENYLEIWKFGTGIMFSSHFPRRLQLYSQVKKILSASESTSSETHHLVVRIWFCVHLANYSSTSDADRSYPVVQLNVMLIAGNNIPMDSIAKSTNYRVHEWHNSTYVGCLSRSFEIA
jgi:hypothetical protein